MDLPLTEELTALTQRISNEVVILDAHMNSPKEYDKLFETYYDYIKQGFEYAGLRKCPVRFKFHEGEDELIHSLELRHFVTNLIFWSPFVRLDAVEDLNGEHIFMCSPSITGEKIQTYIDDKIVKVFRRHISNHELNKTVDNLIFKLSRISTDFNDILGMSISAETFMDVADENPRFDAIIRTKLSDDMQPSEIESTLDSLIVEQMDILRNTDNFLRPMLMAEAGIKDKQLSEFAINGGLKPDLDGNTIPVTINSNFIVGGLSSIPGYYVDSLGGRKAHIMNATSMGTSGHFSRKLMLIGLTVNLDKDVEDCHTRRPVLVKITTNKHLKRLIGRYYRELNVRQYRVFAGDEKHLIGKEVYLRSPATCAAPNGVCHKCYGDLYYTNSDIESVGGLAAARITEPLSQNILSSKHLLTTRSNKVEFPPDFDRFFSVRANEICIQEDTKEDLSRYMLMIIKQNVINIVEYDDNEFNSFVNVFHIYDAKTKQIIEIQESHEMDLFLSPELVERMEEQEKKLTQIDDRECYVIPFDSFDVDERIFVAEIMNNELTKPLYSIMHLLDRRGNDGFNFAASADPTLRKNQYYSVDAMVNRLLDLLIESKIDADSVHAEILIRTLLRDESDILKRPDFSMYTKYQVLTVSSALKNNPSVTLSLSFQDLKEQLKNPLTFKKKGSSFIDEFYRDNPMD